MICIENWEFINYSKLCRCGGFLWITGLPNKKFTNPRLKRLEALYLILLFNSDKNLLNVHNASNTEALFFFTKMNKTKQSLSVEIKGNLLIIICTSKRGEKSMSKIDHYGFVTMLAEFIWLFLLHIYVLIQRARLICK